MSNFMIYRNLSFEKQASWWQYSLVLAELETKLKSNVKILGRVRNALGRFVATPKIRCGLCAIVYCWRHGQKYNVHGDYVDGRKRYL